MTFDEAIDIVRKSHPNRLIWNGYEYDGKFIFNIAIDMTLIRGDLALSIVTVDKDTGETNDTGLRKIAKILFDNFKETKDLTEVIKWKEAAENAIWVDVSREDAL